MKKGLHKERTIQRENYIDKRLYKERRKDSWKKTIQKKDYMEKGLYREKTTQREDYRDKRLYRKRTT